MRMHSKCLLAGLPLALAATLVSTALAVDVRVTIRNLSPDSSVALSPFTLAAHNGSFDAFDVSSAARAGIEDVAELGDGANLSAEATAAPASAAIATAIATQGGFGPGIFRPGASGSIVLSLDPAMHRYLSYGSMVVPSNDAFLGNDSPGVDVATVYQTRHGDDDSVGRIHGVDGLPNREAGVHDVVAGVGLDLIGRVVGCYRRDRVVRAAAILPGTSAATNRGTWARRGCRAALNPFRGSTSATQPRLSSHPEAW